MWQALKDQGVIVVGIGTGGKTGNDAAYIADFTKAMGITFPILVDVDETYTQYEATDKIAPFPMDVVVDKTGKVIMVTREYDIVEIQSAINAALAAP